MDADRRLVDAHREAKHNYKDKDGLPRPVAQAPTLIMSDTTAEGILRKLDQARGDCALVNSEARTQFSGWNSGQGSERMLSSLNGLFDGGDFTLNRTSEGGRDYHVSQAAFTMSIALQSRPGFDLFAAPNSADGLTARTLLVWASGEPYAAPELPKAKHKELRAAVDAFNAIIAKARARQDAGKSWTNSSGGLKRPRRNPVSANAAAKRELRRFYDAGYQVKAANAHHQSFLHRQGELAARLAVTFAAWDGLSNGQDVRVDAALAEAACKLTLWHGGEVVRITGRAGETEFTRDCQRAMDLITDIAAGHKYPALRGDDGSVRQSSIRKAGGKLAGDSEYLQKVAAFLIGGGYLAARNQGRGAAVFPNPYYQGEV